jgi:diguanylate cyclase (GGDEF)-like protein
MDIRDKRADLIVLPALCGLVVSLFAVGYIGGKFIELRALRSQADSVVTAVTGFVEDRIGPNLTYAPHLPKPDANTILRSIPVPESLTRYADLRSVMLLNDRGRIAAPAATSMPEAFVFHSSEDRATYERALRSRSVQYLRAEDMPGRFRTIFYAPLVASGSPYGVVRIDLDQTRDAALLEHAIGPRRVLAAALGLIGLLVTILMFWRFIKERWMAEDEIRFLAMHDVLTKLPNRAQFKLRLERALDRAWNDGTTLAVICIDVDNFKDINDTLGHPVGDRILRSTAERILAVSGPTSTVARLSGDEFAVLIEEVKGTAALRNAAERILRNASIVNEIDGHELVCSISMGISMAPADGNDVDTLLKNADLALYRAKSEGRNRMAFFTNDMDRELRRRRLMEDELRRDLGSDRFKVFYQPQFDLRTGELVGYEALARWTSPTLGIISPDAFVPAAEACGLIGRLSEWMLLTACESATKWDEPQRLAVNLSAAQFKAGEAADMIEKVLRWTKLPPERLEIEITETVLLKNTEAARETLNRLRTLGVSVALDDFGTGYSSLSYLSRFPIDKIKIDRSFVQQMAEDQNMTAIVQAIVGLGEILDVEIVAEGVETHDQVARLRAVGCHQVQGYLFGAPRETIGFPAPDVVLQQKTLMRAAG